MLSTHINELKELLTQYLNGARSRERFMDSFRIALAEYREFIDDRPYYPLNDICDSGRWSDSDLQKYCRQALERLPREELDRETRHWVQSNLVVGDAFGFTSADVISKFGVVKSLYSTDVTDGSFLLSALDGVLRPLSFKYQSLLSALREVGASELAAWVYCSEPDNAFAHIGSIWSLGNVYREPSQLSQLETTRGDSVQWGNCYLLLIPAKKDWLLANHYSFDRFEISLHGTEEFVDKIVSRIGA